MFENLCFTLFFSAWFYFLLKSTKEEEKSKPGKNKMQIDNS